MSAHHHQPHQVGDRLVVVRTFSQSDFDRFAVLSGDDNPIHVDPSFAARTRFGRTVAHGMLLYSTVCAALNQLIPGAWQLEQELMFPTPTYTNEEVSVQLKVTSLPGTGLVELSTEITRPGGQVALQGRTVVRQPPYQLHGPAVDHADLHGATPNRENGEDTTPVPPYKGLAAGQGVMLARTYTQADLQEYRQLVGDANPLFSDLIYAQTAHLNQNILPGGLLGGLFSYLLGTRLPGRGTNWLKQKLLFLAPAYPGEEIQAQVRISRIRPEKNLVNLSTVCMSSSGVTVCEGEALVYVEDLETG